MWLDTDTENMVMKDCEWSQNEGGLGLENNQGPVAIVNCTMAHNKSWGLSIDKSQNGLLAGCTIAGNIGAQIFLAGPPATSVKNWETKQTVEVLCRNWVFDRNVVATEAKDVIYAQTIDSNYLAARAAGALIVMPQWDGFLATLISRGNLWYHPLTDGAFQVGSLATGERLVGLSFDYWRGLTGQDLDSVFAAPGFLDMRRDDFRLAASSPGLNWEERKPLGDDSLAETRRELSPGLLRYAEKLQKLRGASAPGALRK